jgi:hypothetical protein
MITTTEQETEVITEPGQKLSLHIYLESSNYEKLKKLARYAVLEGFIEGHPRGNFSQFCDFAFNCAEAYLKAHAARRRQIPQGERRGQ